jgi:hypothetical protein
MVLTSTLPTRTAGAGIGGPLEFADVLGLPHEATAQMKPQIINEWKLVLIDIIHF